MASYQLWLGGNHGTNPEPSSNSENALNSKTKADETESIPVSLLSEVATTPSTNPTPVKSNKNDGPAARPSPSSNLEMALQLNSMAEQTQHASALAVERLTLALNAPSHLTDSQPKPKAPDTPPTPFVSYGNQPTTVTRHKAGNSPLEKLPAETLLCIARHSDIVSAAILSITSKTLFHKMGDDHTRILTSIPRSICFDSRQILELSRALFLNLFNCSSGDYELFYCKVCQRLHQFTSDCKFCAQMFLREIKRNEKPSMISLHSASTSYCTIRHKVLSARDFKNKHIRANDELFRAVRMGQVLIRGEELGDYVRRHEHEDFASYFENLSLRLCRRQMCFCAEACKPPRCTCCERPKIQADSWWRILAQQTRHIGYETDYETVLQQLRIYHLEQVEEEQRQRKLAGPCALIQDRHWRKTTD